MNLGEAELKALMIASLEGEAAAYRLLLGALQRRLDGYFRRRLPAGAAEAEDLVQETLIAVHQKRATYDRSQAFTAWAHSIARYKLVDHYRRAGRRGETPLDEADELFVKDESGAAEARVDVERLLAALPARTQALIRAVRLEETSALEAAEREGMSEGAVKVAVHRGLRALAERLSGGRP